MEKLADLTTESRSAYTDLDTLSIPEILRIINREDCRVPDAVAQELPQIALAVEVIVSRLKKGGRLFYVGAGTSGRLGVLDAAECPPTFGVPEDLVQGVIAGGPKALVSSVETVEDNPEAGANDLAARHLGPADVVVAIAASGRTPYCIGALRYAASVGAARIALVCNKNSAMEAEAEITIAPVVGPEVIMGSTRMKAGTAQKLVLNMLSTVSMIKLGKVYSNLMVDLTPTNSKLINRAQRIVELATGADATTIEKALQASGYDVKAAIVMILADCTVEKARQALAASEGNVRRAIEGETR
ncbi:MAG: N-acetylmuramic acid 6-phosphate etherase [Firmicutes bacterium]|jgi:N-acetylmuramic acid 6-phosphate etherase|nr:N-acetylmuramic acid 6-phosphate etherase [Bacillota bacterium]